MIKIRKPTKQLAILEQCLSLLLAVSALYLLTLRAIDTGSLGQWFVVLALVGFIAIRLTKITKYIFKNL